jgi:mutator protein MutT
MNEQFERLITRVESLMARIESVLPQPLTAPDWSASVAYRYRKRSSGHGSLEPVRHIGNMSLGDLKEIEDQKEKIKRNTEQFVLGKPANNVLLTGARGTGKSSLIKACLNEYSSRGLRLIEVDKADLTDLPDIVDVVSGLPEKFIVFCDDLSFEEGEPGYKALKSILDGSVAAATPNVLIYATSNRRHLLPEYMTENLTYTHGDDGEVHPGEVVEEKISLSERFGLWVSFYPFTQDEYLTIVAQWLSSFGVGRDAIAAAKPASLVWALERGSRSGRVAYQFARDYAGRDSASRPVMAPAIAAYERPGAAAGVVRSSPRQFDMSVLVADAERPREGGADRKVVDVAVGVLIRPDGDFLLTSRPPGKVYEGYWEFPGGKLEQGESVEAALRRELQEEIGVTIGAVHPWKVEMVDYPHALVRLNFCKVYEWTGELQMHEGQSHAWQSLPVSVQPVLPGTVPVLDWFAEERGFAGATC